MSKKESKSWYDSFEDLDDNKQYEYMMKLFDDVVPNDHLNHEDLSLLICDVYEVLKKKRRFNKMVALYNKVYDSSHLIRRAFYMDTYLIDYYLYTQNKDELKKCFKNFLSDPVDSIDTFIPMFDKLIYYGYRDLSLEIALDVFEKVKNGSGLRSGAETDFSNMIYSEYMQDIYQGFKNNKPLKKSDIINSLMPYDYDLNDAIDRIFKLLEPGSFLLPEYSEYQKNKSDFMNDLALLFMRYMLEEKGMTFSTSGDIWFVTSGYFCMDKAKKQDNKHGDNSGGMFPWLDYNDDYDDEDFDFDDDDDDEEPMFMPDGHDPAIDKKGLKTEGSGSFDTVFNLDEETLDLDISGRMDFISNKRPNGFAVSWGMAYVYDFLYKHKYISDELYEESLEIIAENKDELFMGYKKHLWEFAFISTWQKPDSMDDAEYIYEKKVFLNSYKINL